MSTDSEAEKSAVNGIRTALGIGGVLSVIAGVLILVWPGQSAAVITAIIAIYAIAAGLVYAGLGIFSKMVETSSPGETIKVPIAYTNPVRSIGLPWSNYTQNYLHFDLQTYNRKSFFVTSKATLNTLLTNSMAA